MKTGMNVFFTTDGCHSATNRVGSDAEEQKKPVLKETPRLSWV